MQTRDKLDFLRYVEGPSNLTFTSKDAHNFLAKERRNVVLGGDSNTAMGLLDDMKYLIEIAFMTRLLTPMTIP